MSFISENKLELWAVGQIQDLGFTYVRGDALSPEAANPEREAFHEALLLDRFKASLKRINPDLPAAALTEVFNKVRDMQFGGDLLAENRRIHDLMVRGVQVTYWEGSEEKNALAQIVDWKNQANEWLVVNQFEIVGKSARRPDIVIFINGLPVGRYHNRSVDALQVIQELIEIAKSLRDQPEDGLSDEERAFYDALAQNESAIEVLGNDQLQIIAAELVKTVRSKSGVDWWNRRDVRAQMRIAVKRLLRKYGFPPDLQADAVKVVIRQAEAMARAA